MDPEFVRKFFELTDEAKSIVVTSHVSFDDDSISSVLSVFRLLKAKYPDKKIRIVYSGTSSDRYKSFADFTQIEFVDDLVNHLDDTDLLIMLDGSQFTRFSKNLSPDVYKNKSICVDHHASTPSQFTLSFIQPKAMATSELIYELFFKDKSLDKSTAEILLLGLLGDTGDFTYLRPENASVFDMAKVLLTTANCEIQEFKSRYATITPQVFSTLGQFVKNTQFGETSGWPKFMYSFIEREFIEQNKLSDNEISDASHLYVAGYLRSVTNYPWGFTVSPKSDGSCGISLRSLPRSVNVRLVAEALGGGGHDRAAGATVKPVSGKKVEAEECLKQILAWMKSNSPVLS